ncbi:very short patch repair endonuclease [Verrucomicrobia bacterium LW23]|nr:very short patch repair endonuclease [Verrucomicrobia bacterium LW23]
MDTISSAERSALMSRVRSRKNRSTELKLATLFRAAGIKGWRRHYPIIGKPDFVFRSRKIAIFVDGDFWHGNPDNLRIPKSRVDFWMAKIDKNRIRDSVVNSTLKERGWTVIRIWESTLQKFPDECIKRVTSVLS